MIEIGEKPKSYLVSDKEAAYGRVWEYTPGTVKINYEDLLRLYEAGDADEPQFFSARTEDFLNVLKAWGYTVNE